MPFLTPFLSVEVFYHARKLLYLLKSEYIQEMSQSQTTRQPTAQRGRATEISGLN